MTTLSAQESMGTIDAFIQQVGAAEKQAADKSAEAHTEPGSQGGETSHPVKDVDDRCETAKEGERSSENEADVKEDQGKPGVDGTPNAKAAADGKSEGGAVQSPGSASDDHLQIGTNTQPTGEDSSVETSSAKAGKEDPGSSHPARTDNEELDGHKYSADKLDGMSLEDLAQLCKTAGDNLCELIAAESPQPTKTAGEQAKEGEQQKEGEDAEADLAHQAGWELAGLASGNFDKKAADELVRSTLEETIKVAADDADRVAHYLETYAAEKQAGEEDKGGESSEKQAEGGGDPAADPAAAMGSPGGGMPMGGGGGGGEEMLDALGGGEAPADPMAGGGGELGADPQALELAQILEELGVTPEELEAALAEGAGEGAPPEGGGMPGEMPGEMGGMEGGGAPGMEVAAADKKAHKEAIRKEARDYVKEVIGRSRNRQRK